MLCTWPIIFVCLFCRIFPVKDANTEDETLLPRVERSVLCWFCISLIVSSLAFNSNHVPLFIMFIASTFHFWWVYSMLSIVLHTLYRMTERPTRHRDFGVISVNVSDFLFTMCSERERNISLDLRYVTSLVSNLLPMMYFTNIPHCPHIPRVSD